MEEYVIGFLASISETKYFYMCHKEKVILLSTLGFEDFLITLLLKFLRKLLENEILYLIKSFSKKYLLIN